MSGAPEIPNNKSVAVKRLESTTAKLEKAGEFRNYDQILNSWVDEGIIEEVPETEINVDSHYLPHRAVIKPESLTTPVRPVFDASCKVGRAPSLNDCLEKGPNLMELIPSILLRFREKKIGVISDIRKAFQMINVEEKDRNFLRFLWWKEGLRELREFRHCRVVFGVNCSPFILAAVLQFHLDSVEGELQQIAKKLLSSLYVDNCVCSVDQIEDYEHFKKKATELMDSAKMELRQWERSSVGIPEKDSQLGSTVNTTTMVLGLVWNKEKDTLSCNFQKIELDGKITKRAILSSVQKIFDPIGFTAPVTLRPKMMLQNIWQDKVGWDEQLSPELVKRFKKWYEDLNYLGRIEIPRWMKTERVSENEKLQLHCFYDASQHAYAAVVYLRSECENGEVTVQLLQAKSRVAPLKQSTIPRLELLGCVIAARLFSSVNVTLDMEKVKHFFWTDSSTALSWIQRNDDWGTFVGNRVRNILEWTSPNNWRHVPGKLNPADLPSRGCDAQELFESRWWEGPTWLKGAPEE